VGRYQAEGNRHRRAMRRRPGRRVRPRL